VNKIFRTVDDFLPRTQLKIVFSAGTVCLEYPNSIKKFSEKYIFEEDHIRSYVNHLLCLQRAKDIRTNQRKRDKAEVKNKSYEDHDWIELSLSRDTLRKLTVRELEKYLTFHKPSLNGLKNDKITRIMAHINFSNNGSNMHSQYKSVSQNDHQDETEKGDGEDDEEDSEDDEEDSKDDDSDDKILAVFGSDSEDEDSHEES
ncbi:histone chaperone rtt106-like, partial [Stylophora pistillata]|uniref:histone chaperone rtt106-like n=1 Tax=Stylophora pistillata TaxID=50429 RepID=UPI000C040971